MRSFVLTIASFLLAAVAIAQRKPKTIYDALGITDKRCPVDTTNAEDVSLTVVEGITGESTPRKSPAFDINAYARVIGNYLRVAKTDEEPAVVHTFYSTKANNRLERQGSNYTLYNAKGQKVWTRSFFHVEYDSEGFNAWDSGDLSMYYTRDGKLLFNKKFRYVSPAGEFFNFYENKNVGLVDRNGKILFPAKYKKIYPYRFNSQLYYQVTDDRGSYIMGPDGKKVVLVGFSDGFTSIAGRYWMIDQQLYDIKARQKLFCDGFRSIDIIDAAKGWLKMTVNNNIYFFDIKTGHLLIDEPAISFRWITPQLYLVGFKGRDTIQHGRKTNLFTYGIVNANLKWKVPLNDYAVIQAVDNDTSVFLYMKHGSRSIGLMDVNGKEIIPNNRYKYISFLQPGKFICATDSASWIFDRKTGTFAILPKTYASGTPVKIYNKQHYQVALINGKREVVDSNFNTIPGTEGIQYCRFEPIINRCVAAFDDGRKKMIDAQWKENPATIAGRPTAWLRDIRKASDSIGIYTLADSRNIVQYPNGQWFETSYTSLGYDEHAKWFMAYSTENGWYAILDSMGKELMPPLSKYHATYSPSQRWITMLMPDDKYYTITNEGRVLFNGQYDFITPFFKYYIVSKGNLRGIVDRNGKEILPVIYSYLVFEEGELRFGDSYLNYKTWGISKLR